VAQAAPEKGQEAVSLERGTRAVMCDLYYITVQGLMRCDVYHDLMLLCFGLRLRLP